MYKTYQEAFDQTIDKLVAQGNFGYDYEDEMCLYETQEGNRCAVGINLSQNALEQIKNSEKMDSRLYGIWDVVENELRITDDPDKDFTFWNILQDVHDKCAGNPTPSENPLAILKEIFNVDTSKVSLLQDMARKIEDARQESNVLSIVDDDSDDTEQNGPIKELLKFVN